MIKTEKLCKSFTTKISKGGVMGLFKKKEKQTVQVVKNLNLEIKEGEFVAFLGPNGAGKTTTLKMLTGVLYPTSGKIDIFGYTPYQKVREFKKSISFVMAQKSQLFMELPIKDSFDFIAEIYEVDKTKYKKLLDNLVERFELGDKLKNPGRKLSLGQRMKCELICSLIYEPKVIFLDEPTIGLDVNSSKEVRKLLKELNQDFSTTLILTTHNMEDVEELCQRTVVISKGEKFYDGSTAELKKIFGDKREIEFIISKGDPAKLILPKELENEVDVLQKSDSKIILQAERNLTTTLISHIMQDYELLDINFHEQNLSDVIGKLYKR